MNYELAAESMVTLGRRQRGKSSKKTNGKIIDNPEYEKVVENVAEKETVKMVKKEAEKDVFGADDVSSNKKRKRTVKRHLFLADERGTKRKKGHLTNQEKDERKTDHKDETLCIDTPLNPLLLWRLLM